MSALLRQFGDATLRETLRRIEEHDTDYATRYGLVITAMSAALLAGYSAGIAIDPKDPDWPVVYIELPTGQVSWHMPKHSFPYDGHSTAEKYARIHAYVTEVP